MLIVVLLSLFALGIAVIMQLIVGITIIKALALFLGLEGTILLASALSPPRVDVNAGKPPGILSGLLWQFKEGRELNYPVNYNPVFFYGGLLLLATSFVLSSIPG